MNVISKGLLSLVKMFDKKSFSGSNTFFIGDDFFVMGDSSKNYIQEGYNKNADVYAIVSLAARKFAQVPWYVYKVKKGATKELKQYKQFSRNNTYSYNSGELKALRKKALDESVVDNDLSELLNKPNEYQGQDGFFEMWYGLKLLTGEGNLWKNRGGRKEGKVLELHHVPKHFIELIGRQNNPYVIDGWKIDFGAGVKDIAVNDLIMWKLPCYVFDINTKSHLRGQSPLLSLLLDLQASNENAKNKLKMNKNQGARGILVDKTNDGLKPVTLNPQQESDLRRLINSKINSNDNAGAVVNLSGLWDYLSIGMDANQLKMIEQSNLSTEKLCAGYNVPYEFFNPQTTFANKEQAARHFVYNHIAPAAYSARDELNRSLLADFELDANQYIIEPDVLSLPEAMEDLGKQVTMLNSAWWLTPNQRLEKMGEDKSADPNMDKVYIPSSLQTLENANMVIGGNLDNEQNLLTNNNAI